MASQKVETRSDGFDESVGNLDAAAFLRDVISDVIEFGLGFQCNACAISGRQLLSGQPIAPTLLHFVGQLAHRFLGDSAPFALREGNLRYVHGC